LAIFAFEVKVGVPEFFVRSAESKWFSEHGPETVSVFCNVESAVYLETCTHMCT